MNPTRLRILRYLRTFNAQYQRLPTLGELAHNLDISRLSLNEHLHVLARLGWLKLGERSDGVYVTWYRIPGELQMLEREG